MVNFSLKILTNYTFDFPKKFLCHQIFQTNNSIFGKGQLL